MAKVETSVDLVNPEQIHLNGLEKTMNMRSAIQ